MNSPEWSDAIRSRLLDERVVSLFGRLDDATITDLAAQLWSLDATGDAPITLLLSVTGGSVSATLALLDVLDVIGVQIHVTCIGGLTGPPIAILGAADRRQAAPSARFVFHEEPVSFEGSFRNLEGAARNYQQQRQQLLGRIANSTRGSHSLGDVVADFERRLGMSAEEARSYGLVDRVAAPRDRLVRLARPTPGFGFRRP